MQNSIVMPHTNRRCYTAPRDPFQTHTGDETCLLPATTQASALKTAASWAIPQSQCAGCGVGGRMLSAEKAAMICQCSRRLIYRWIEEGSLHYRELPDGTVLVCGVTLAVKLEQLEDATGHLAR